MNSQGANTAGIHDNVYTADALVRRTGLGSILLEKSCFLNVQDLTSSESGANRGWQGQWGCVWGGSSRDREGEDDTEYRGPRIKNRTAYCEIWGGGCWPCCAIYGILVPQPRIKPTPLALEAQSFNPWATRGVHIVRF